MNPMCVCVFVYLDVYKGVLSIHYEIYFIRLKWQSNNENVTKLKF